MKEKRSRPVRRFIENVAKNTATGLLKILFLFIFNSGVIGVLTHIATTQIKYLVQYALIISTSVALGLGYLITTFILRNREFDYQILEKIYEYEYLSLTSMTLRKTVTIKALTRKCDRFFERYIWTGSGPATMTCENKSYNIIETPRTDCFQRTEIRFERTLRLWEKITIVLDYILDDPHQIAVPFLSTTVIEPTKKQTLIVSVPKDWALKDAIIEIRRCAEDHHTESSNIIEFEYGVCKWEMEDPELHKVYSIKWDLKIKKDK